MREFTELSIQELVLLHDILLEKAEMEYKVGNKCKVIEIFKEAKEIRIELLTKVTKDRDIAQKIINHDIIEII